MDRRNKPPLDRYDFNRIENMWIHLVLDAIASYIARGEMCDCQDCVLDVTAIALNCLPPKYWIMGSFDAFSPPELFLKDSANKSLAQEAVIKAIRLVERNPHH